MVLGVDFDNTIVGYDEVFHRVALEQGLIPAGVTPDKVSVRRYLVGQGLEDAWTEMQGLVYGERMLDAAPFPGVLDFFKRCRARGLDVFIISHRTRTPYRGPKYDLHQAAHRWLEYHGFYCPDGIGLGRDRVFFELTKGEKLARIAQVGCSHFIDDLPEILGAAEFPAKVERILFGSGSQNALGQPFRRVASWSEVESVVGGEGQGAA